MAICIACRLKMPKLSRNRSGVEQHLPKRQLVVPLPEWRRRHHAEEHADGRQGENAGDGEQARHADPAVEERRPHSAKVNGEGRWKNRSSPSPGAVLLPRQIGGQGRDRRRNRPRPWSTRPTMIQWRSGAAKQSGGGPRNRCIAAPAWPPQVGRRCREGNLKERLNRPQAPKAKPPPGQIATIGQGFIHRKYRQDDKSPGMQGKDGSKRSTGTRPSRVMRMGVGGACWGVVIWGEAVEGNINRFGNPAAGFAHALAPAAQQTPAGFQRQRPCTDRRHCPITGASTSPGCRIQTIPWLYFRSRTQKGHSKRTALPQERNLENCKHPCQSPL